MVLSIIIYTVCWIISYMIVCNGYNSVKGTALEKSSSKRKLSIFAVIVISLLFTFYNYYLTTHSTGMAADRVNYLTEFEGDRESPSLGLIIVQSLIIVLGGDFYTLLYVTSFISILFPLLAYRYSKDATPLSLLLFFVSLYIIASFVALKQAYTSAFTTLALVLMLDRGTMIKDLFTVVLIFLSCLFHSSGFILIPIYLFVRFFNYYFDYKRILIFIILLSLFWEPAMKAMSVLLSGVIPSFAGKLDEYFGEGADKWEDSGVLVVFKGIPFYYISYLGIKWRDKLKGLIKSYDNYLLVSIVCSALLLMSAKSYWMLRFMYLFIFVVYIFFGTMLRYIPNKKEASFIVFFTTALFTYRELCLVFTKFGGI